MTDGEIRSARQAIWQAPADEPDVAVKIDVTGSRPIHAPCAPCARAPGSSSASDDVFFWLGDFAELRKLAKTPPEKKGDSGGVAHGQPTPGARCRDL